MSLSADYDDQPVSERQELLNRWRQLAQSELVEDSLIEDLSGVNLDCPNCQLRMITAFASRVLDLIERGKDLHYVYFEWREEDSGNKLEEGIDLEKIIDFSIRASTGLKEFLETVSFEGEREFDVDEALYWARGFQVCPTLSFSDEEAFFFVRRFWLTAFTLNPTRFLQGIRAAIKEKESLAAEFVVATGVNLDEGTADILRRLKAVKDDLEIVRENFRNNAEHSCGFCGWGFSLKDDFKDLPLDWQFGVTVPGRLPTSEAEHYDGYRTIEGLVDRQEGEHRG